METIPFWQVDAFTSEVFSGNPAAVCVMEHWLPDDLLQQIAAENNLSETAFLVAKEGGGYRLRWMTPVAEVDLCGHATLASGWVVLNELEPDAQAVRFETRSGTLSVEVAEAGYAMDFPARPGAPCDASEGLAAALGVEPHELFETDFNYLAVLGSAQDVWSLEPDFAAIASLPHSVIATAPGEGEIDFPPVVRRADQRRRTLAPLQHRCLQHRDLLLHKPRGRRVTARGGRDCVWCVPE